MFEDFDELFENYFNKRKNRMSSFDELFNEMFFNLSKSYLLNEKLKEDDSELGPPDKVLEITENGASFTKSIWNTPAGYIVKVELANNNKKNIPLEEKLKMAIETENYEEAAKIRDEIKKTKKNEKN